MELGEEHRNALGGVFNGAAAKNVVHHRTDFGFLLLEDHLAAVAQEPAVAFEKELRIAGGGRGHHAGHLRLFLLPEVVALPKSITVRRSLSIIMFPAWRSPW